MYAIYTYIVCFVIKVLFYEIAIFIYIYAYFIIVLIVSMQNSLLNNIIWHYNVLIIMLNKYVKCKDHNYQPNNIIK